MYQNASASGKGLRIAKDVISDNFIQKCCLLQTSYDMQQRGEVKIHFSDIFMKNSRNTDTLVRWHVRYWKTKHRLPWTGAQIGHGLQSPRKQFENHGCHLRDTNIACSVCVNMQSNLHLGGMYNLSSVLCFLSLRKHERKVTNIVVIHMHYTRIN